MLYEKYKNEVVPVLKEKLGIKNPMLMPRLEKIVVSSTTGDAVQNPKVLDTIVAEITAITGQKPIVTRAKKSVASFKLREGQPIGVCVTLRRERMYEFLSRLINISLPRTRDFKGLPKNAFDGNGNYNMGIQEQIIFSEISPEKVEKSRGMNVTLVTNTNCDNQARELLVALGMPLRA